MRTLYFFKHFQYHCQAPPNMLDSNFAMDRAKIAYIARLPGGRPVILDAVQDETPVSVRQLEDRFGPADMLTETQDTRFMASLLCYLGVLTLGGRTALGKLILTIPNLVIRKLYVEHLQRMLLPLGPDRDAAAAAAEALYSTGNLQPVCDFIEQHYFKVLDNRDYRWANDGSTSLTTGLTLKTMFLTLLFDDTFYIVDSETAVGRTYGDLTLIVRPEMRQYQLLDILIEFKYVKPGDAGLSGEEARRSNLAELKTLPAIQQPLTAAKTKLQGYRAVLEARYGEMLRLRAYAVVGLGFDRVVWEEVQQHS